MAQQGLANLGLVTNWQRSRLKGEENLMLIHANLNNEELSLGIRNSGTQAKISVSLRLSSDENIDGLDQFVDSLVAHLKIKMG